MTPQADDISRAGFVAIIGAPNAGKSTLVNRLVGAKVAIVTHKVQTTRFAVRGVAHHGDAQLVLIDTPGIFHARKRLDRAMVQAAWSGAGEADMRVHLVDAASWVADAQDRASPAQMRSIEDDRRVIEALKARGLRAFLALNKVDLFAHEQLLPVMAALHAEGVYDEIFPVSAVNGEGIDTLAGALAARMPEARALYPPEQTADLPMRLLAAEITREKLMLRLHQELPYELTVETEAWQERADGSVRIQQVVIVSRDSHKAMVLGKGGAAIRDVGRAAREELTTLMERKVHLFLFVKTDPKWQDRRESYEGLGLEFDA
ncbi:MAG: GTPase Era [Alphaproteobacteria bacterium]|jgi:GTP-binding protein Era|nr:GTPase Era [Alphaproteobacteria bacterium]